MTMSAKSDNSSWDNVIILGAGASCDAGVPMLGSFMDTMWNLAKLGKNGGVQLSELDRKLLSDALAIRDELDSFHGRASLDVWNIEEVLSLLSFNALADGKNEGKKLELMTKAIARTIELKCTVRSEGKLNERVSGDIQIPGVYLTFWRGLFAWAAKTGSPLPPIITFNYDLILERSLLYSVIGTQYAGSERFPGKGIRIDYHTDCMAPIFLKHKFADFWKQERSNGIPSQERGLILEECAEQELEQNALGVDLLKLHGSCNFPKPRRTKQELPPAGERLALALEDPLILPPIFNKATETVGTGAWACAMQAMRHCKNLIICGYSLPQTDIYMQYFLKAALGPNRDLNKIFVFDPILFAAEPEAEGTALKSRYAGNFSDPIQKRIEFQPAILEKHRGSGGTFEHLSWLLMKHPELLLFG